MEAQHVITLPTTTEAPEHDALEALALLTEEIAADARQAPEAYLHDTRVPEGGE